MGTRRSQTCQWESTYKINVVSHCCCPYWTQHGGLHVHSWDWLWMLPCVLLMLLTLLSTSPGWRLPVPWVAGPWSEAPSGGVPHCSWHVYDLYHLTGRGAPEAKSLAILSSLMEVALFSSKSYMVSNELSIGRNSAAGRGTIWLYMNSSFYTKTFFWAFNFSFCWHPFSLWNHLLIFYISNWRRKDKEMTLKIVLLHCFLEVS